MDYGSDQFSYLPYLIVAVPVLLVMLWPIVTYNRLVSLRNLIPESWSNVDTELRRRYDLIPNLVETVKAYASHERQVFEMIAQTRTRAMDYVGSPEGHAREENELVRSLKSLLAVSEAYPNLKADQNFLKLQQELINTEDRIQAARRFFNGNIRDYNNLVDTFPSNIIASMFQFEHKQYFEIEEAVARALVSVDFGHTMPH